MVFGKHRLLRPSTGQPEAGGPSPNGGTNEAKDFKTGYFTKMFETEREENFLHPEKSSIRNSRSWYYTLSLEPNQEKRESFMIMLAEAFAIFGALFLNGIWFIWEYGRSRDFVNENLERAFQFLCAVAIINATLVAMFGSFLWMLALMFSKSQPNFMLGSVQFFTNLILMLQFVFLPTMAAMCIGVYNVMQDHLVEAIVLLVMIVVFGGATFVVGNSMLAEQVPLETYHFPLWFKSYMPRILVGSYKRQLKDNACARAAELKKLAMMNQLSDDEKKLQELLVKACSRLGKSGEDVGPYMRKLQSDWLDSVDQIMEENVDTLRKYMPYALAKKVYDLLSERRREKVDE